MDCAFGNHSRVLFETAFRILESRQRRSAILQVDPEFPAASFFPGKGFQQFTGKSQIERRNGSLEAEEIAGRPKSARHKRCGEVEKELFLEIVETPPHPCLQLSGGRIKVVSLLGGPPCPLSVGNKNRKWRKKIIF